MIDKVDMKSANFEETPKPRRSIRWVALFLPSVMTIMAVGAAVGIIKWGVPGIVVFFISILAVALFLFHQFIPPLIGFLYPLSFIQAQKFGIGWWIFVSLFGLTAFGLATTYLHNIRSHAKIVLGSHKSFLFMLLAGSLLVSLKSREFQTTPLQYTSLVSHSMYIILYVLTINSFLNKTLRRHFVLPFIAGVSILACLSYIQYFLRIPIVYEWQTGLEYYGRLYSGEWLAPNRISDIYLFSIALLVGGILFSKNKRKKIWILFGIVLLSGAFILIQTRSALIGFLVGLASGLILMSVKGEFDKRKVVVLLIIASTAVILLEVLGEFVMFERFTMERFIYVEASTRDRLQQVSSTFYLALDNPFGLSREDYLHNIMEYGGLSMTPHNVFLQKFVETGWLGGIGYLGIYFLILTRLGKLSFSKMDGEMKGLRLGLIIGLISYGLNNLFHTPGMQFDFWLILGASEALCLINKKNSGKAGL